MTYTEIAEFVDSLGLPNAYYQFPDGTSQAPPFIVFFFASADFVADNANYARKEQLNIELYTDDKDFELEAQIEGKLTEAGFAFGKQQAYVDTERFWQTAYTMEVFVNG